MNNRLRMRLLRNENRGRSHLPSDAMQHVLSQDTSAKGIKNLGVLTAKLPVIKYKCDMMRLFSAP
jgi:hypothetical protein